MANCFKHALVRRPGRSFIDGITTANLGKPDYREALHQHDQYIGALEACGVAVTVLAAEENYPDSVFVEDTAVLTPGCAVITHPGAASRQGEEVSIRKALEPFYDRVYSLEPPDTLEGGDVMQVGMDFYVGLSARTNAGGIRRFADILKTYDYSVSAVEMREFLHLKTGLAYLGDNLLLVSGEFVDNPLFKDFDRIVVPKEEGYAANCIRVNDAVIFPAGYPRTRDAVAATGLPVVEVDVSEFRKLDGGLSCLSLRF